jgi:hypothetical protein
MIKNVEGSKSRAYWAVNISGANKGLAGQDIYVEISTGSFYKKVKASPNMYVSGNDGGGYTARISVEESLMSENIQALATAEDRSQAGIKNIRWGPDTVYIDMNDIGLSPAYLDVYATNLINQPVTFTVHKGNNASGDALGVFTVEANAKNKKVGTVSEDNFYTNTQNPVWFSVKWGESCWEKQSYPDTTYGLRWGAGVGGPADFGKPAAYFYVGIAPPTITTIPYTDTDGNYTVNWTTVAYDASYVLYENDIEVYNGTELTKSFTNKPNTNYIYRVVAWNINGTSSPSSPVTIIVSVNGAPNLPYISTITTTSYTDTDGNYNVNWNTSNYAEWYNLYENNIMVYNGTNLTTVFTGKANGSYTYKLKAWNANGTSANSTPIVIIVQLSVLPEIPIITTASYTDTDGNYTINWTTSSYAMTYILEEDGVSVYNGTNLTYSLTSKPDGTYTYRIRAWNSNGTSLWSSAVIIIVGTHKFPGTPPITTASYTDTDGNYSINWSSSIYVDRYILEENSTEIYNGTNLTYSFTSKADDTYTYRVKAWNTNGTSNWSSSITVIVDIAKLPRAPSITTVAYVDTDGTYAINWTTSAYADKYILEENGTETYNGSALTYSFTGKADDTYNYTVRAWNANGTSNRSSALVITVFGPKIPTTPTITTASYTDTDGNYSVNWIASAYATTYILEEDGVSVYNGTNLTHLLTGKSDGSYTYRIRAWNINGTSNWSTALTIVVDNAKLPTVPTITTTAPYPYSGSSYSITWATSAYADKYILEENGIEIYNGTNTTYQFIGKADGAYTYKVKARNTNGTSSWNATLVITVFGLKTPVVPITTTLSYTDTDGSYSINWTTSAYADKYILEENDVEICNETALTYSFTGKSDGTYIYRVKAWNNNGTSNQSTSVTITVDNAKLLGSLNITTVPYTDIDGAYNVNWTASAYATSYILYENDIEIYNGTNTTMSFIKPNGTYAYKVKAWNINRTSSYSLPVTITVTMTSLVTTNEPPTVSITSQFSGKVNGTITITGNASDDVSVQYIQLNIDDSGWITVDGTATWSYSLNTTKYSDGKHTIKVRAYDGTQNSTEQSLVVDVKNTKETRKENGFVPGFEIPILLVVIGIIGLFIISSRKRKN